VKETGSIIDIVTTSPGSGFPWAWVVAVVVSLAVGWAIHFALSEFFRTRPAGQPRSPTERQFRNVFAMMDEGRRQSLVRYHMEKHECDREEAMRRAMDERRRDADRWS